MAIPQIEREIQHIKQAMAEGKKVYWSSELYIITADKTCQPHGLGILCKSNDFYYNLEGSDLSQVLIKD